MESEPPQPPGHVSAVINPCPTMDQYTLTPRTSYPPPLGHVNKTPSPPPQDKRVHPPPPGGLFLEQPLPNTSLFYIPLQLDTSKLKRQKWKSSDLRLVGLLHACHGDLSCDWGQTSKVLLSVQDSFYTNVVQGVCGHLQKSNTLFTVRTAQQ